MSSTATLESTLDFAPAVLDPAHIGDIEGAFGTVSMHDRAPRRGLLRRLATFAAIVGPGLIVMVGDNDAGGVQTYTQAGQAYGYSLLWVLVLLAPVLVVNQEMAARLGTVTGVGHARLIRERFGRLWASFAVLDLLVLNFLTLLTEFIGIYFGLAYFGVPKLIALPASGVTLFAIAASGRFRVWERALMVLIAASFVFVPAMLVAHPRWGAVAHGLIVPGVAGGVSSPAILLIVAMIGTTVAPWQLFFQQSNVLDKRITPRWLNYERADTFFGAALTTIAAGGMIIFGTALFDSHRYGPPAVYSDSGWFDRAIASTLGPAAGAMAAIMLVVAAVIGAGAVSLSSSYAFGDSFGARHSLHRSIRTAPLFYGVYAAQIVAACLLVALGSNDLLGTLTQYVQVLAAILLPSATLLLLLLCNDADVLGPWINGRAMNAFVGAVIVVLTILSVDLTISTLFSSIDGVRLTELCFSAGGALAVALAPVILQLRRRAIRQGRVFDARAAVAGLDRAAWRMAPLDRLPRPRPSLLRSMSLYGLRAYMTGAAVIVGVRALRPFIG
ncbi:MAG TPA: NRAMP family divalent metal transporter [Solirubrobacteraceae bacterium]|nr:NRAMP family divalent metal transporter [Solirubrobacteraceae bacterium]